MPGLVVVGTQWGDEGKGKVVDFATESADVVVRFQGGNNAGHTLVVDGKTTKLNLVPSGILRPKTRCVIGAGVVVTPEVLAQEVDDLQAAGVKVSPDRLLLDRSAHLVLDYHRALDIARETHRGAGKIGTTGRGIGPAYEDRANRSGVRFADLADLENLQPRLKNEFDLRVKYLERVLEAEHDLSFESMWSTVCKTAERFLPYVENGSVFVDAALRAGKHVVFEGAQGTFLDQMHGTIPYVTSSSTIAGAVTTGCGIGAKSLDHVLGIAKAYTTRVGSGPFPTELTGELGDRLRDQGKEYGTVTNRPRRCGWFDAVALRSAVRLNGIDSLAITKLDVLSGFDSIRVCIKYQLDGKTITDMPALAADCERVEPEYIELEGWQEPIGEAKKWHHLPPTARLYLDSLADICGCSVSLISVGPERSATILPRGAEFLRQFSHFTKAE